MTRKVWVPTGNLAWRKIEELTRGTIYSRRMTPNGHEDAEYELVQEVVEVQINDGDNDREGSVDYTGAVEWRPIPILPANPPPPTRENFLQYSTVVTNTEPRT